MITYSYIEIRTVVSLIPIKMGVKTLFSKLINL